MPRAPDRPLIYHITHLDNLPRIIATGGLLSDAAMIAQGGPEMTIGMGLIKQRRLRLPVRCHPGSAVGDYVPFYFCPRSVMLFVIHCANSPELKYRGGEGPIVHLEADFHEAVRWANEMRRRWAISLSNAGTAYATFRAALDALGEINWPAVRATDFRTPEIKEGKQAEFLVHESFPWGLVSRIGVKSVQIRARVERALTNAAHRPAVVVMPNWYFGS